MAGPELVDPRQIQGIIDLRALEIAKETSTLLAAHQGRDELLFTLAREQTAAVALSVVELRGAMQSDKKEIIGAVQTLRSEESSKRGALYAHAWKIVWSVLAGLVALVIALIAFIWNSGVHQAPGLH